MRQEFRPFLVLVFFFVLLFGYIKIAGPIPFFINSVTTNKTDVFTVTGEGKVDTKPDIAFVNVGVSVTAPTVKSAQDQMNNKINQVTSAVKNLGIENKDIKTANYNIYPNTDYQNGTQKITGFTASTNLSIKIKNIDLVNQVIDVSTASGANQVGGVTFEIEEKVKVENEARSKAVQNAKEKAQQSAKIAGFSLGKIINYSEDFGNFPRPLNVSIKTMEVVDGTPQTAVEPGSSEVIVVVSLSYQIN